MTIDQWNSIRSINKNWPIAIDQTMANNSAQSHQYHFTLTKLAILLTTSASSRLNYRPNNGQQLSTATPVSLHFNQVGHSINDVRLIPIELIPSKRDSVRKAREAHLINKARTLHPFGVNKRDEARQ